MKFTPLASNSKGNAYLVEAEGCAPLLLEAGIPIKQLREKLDFRLSGLAGCLVSHEHLDHAKAVKDLLQAGVDCYMSRGTAAALGVGNHHRCWTPNLETVFDLPRWFIKPFTLEHDAAEPWGFTILDIKSGDRLLFIPDTAYVKNRFQGVTILAIETNHAANILHDKIISGAIPAVVGHRIRRNHLELDVVKDFILANNMQKTLRQIFLIHLSDTNSDELRFKKEIQEITGVPVYISEA